jgi:hypothetical protein
MYYIGGRFLIFRQLAASGDWTFGKGISGYARDEAAIELNIRTRLQSWKGDCFFALDDFVDWISRLDKGQENNLRRELQNVILQSFGVVSVDGFTSVLNRNLRSYQVTFTIVTIFGTSFINKMNLAAGVPTGS